jgi:hypothetical protein
MLRLPITRANNRNVISQTVGLILLCIVPTSSMLAVPFISQKAGERPVRNTRRIIGLLELPSLFRPEESDVAADAKLPNPLEPIRAYSKRSTESSIVAVVQRPEDIETKEDPYKRACAVVYDALDSWYLIGLKPYGVKSKGWVYVNNSNAFVQLEWVILLADNSCYVTSDWDRELWTKPGERTKVRLLSKPPTRDITVIDQRRINDELWLEVEFSERVSCDWEELPPVVAKGWIRAYTKSDKLQIWYYPRLDC